MAIYHRTQRLQIYGDKPEVTQLFGGRYRMEVRCVAAKDTEAWYNANKDQIFASFGTLYSAEMSIDGIGPRVGEAYANMVLISNKAGYTPTGEYVISFVYETLTDSWVKEKEDIVSSTENGLRTLTRTEVATIDTEGEYDEDGVGVAFISSGGKTLYLAGFENQTKADDEVQIGRFTTRWAEAGVISRTEDFVGSQDSLVIEAIGPDPETPSGFSLASKQESNYEGFRTKRFTFLKDSILSVQQEFDNGRSRISVQAFNLDEGQVDSELSSVISNHQLISINESDYEGIKTTTFQYEIEDFEVRSQTENGLKLVTQTELSTSSFTDSTIGVVGTGDYASLYRAGEEIDNDNTIKRRVTRWAEPGILSVSSRNMSEGVQSVETVFLAVEGTTTGPVYSRRTQNYEGFKTISVTTLQDKSGNSIVDSGSNLVHQYNRKVEFTYPGTVGVRQDILTGTIISIPPNLLNFEIKPPVQSKVDATVSVIFQTSGNIVAGDETYDDGGAGGAADSYWNPTEWAQTYTSGIGWNFAPFVETQALRGYRVDNDVSGITENTAPTGSINFNSNGVTIITSAGAEYLEAVSETSPVRKVELNGVADGGGNRYIINGRRIYGTTPFTMRASGGPVDPSGNKYVLDIDIRPAFEDVDGNVYYKKTIVTATV